MNNIGCKIKIIEEYKDLKENRLSCATFGVGSFKHAMNYLNKTRTKRWAIKSTQLLRKNLYLEFVLECNCYSQKARNLEKQKA